LDEKRKEMTPGQFAESECTFWKEGNWIAAG